jgi:hypothetical protein
LLSFGAESFVFEFAVQYIKIKMYRTIILPVFLYWYVTLSLTLREERRLTVFENRTKRDDIRGVWRKLHNKELNHLYASPYIVRVIKWRRMRWAGNVACRWARGGAYRILIRKPEGKIPLARPGRRWKDNIKMGLHELGWDSWT